MRVASEGIRCRYQEDSVMRKQLIPNFWKNEGPIYMRHKINLNVAVHMNIYLMNLSNVFFPVVVMKTTV